MPIEIKESGESPRYGQLVAGTIRHDIDPEDEKRFIERGIARRVKPHKEEVKKDGKE